MVDASERIDRVEYEEKNDGLEGTTLFYNGPTEFLTAILARELKKVTPWQKIFGEFIDGYMRMDYSMRNLPAIRIYNETFIKESESWFINGDLKLDIIFPANIRRGETQQLQDTLSGAIVQQFRRPEFFILLCDLVPGLNELGKVVTVDKTLGFEWEAAEVPLTQITMNFRLDLRVWDEYLEQTNRTKDSPFEEVLGSLDKIVGEIQGLKDDNATTEVELGVNADTK